MIGADTLRGWIVTELLGHASDVDRLTFRITSENLHVEVRRGEADLNPFLDEQAEDCIEATLSFSGPLEFLGSPRHLLNQAFGQAFPGAVIQTDPVQTTASSARVYVMLQDLAGVAAA